MNNQQNDLTEEENKILDELSGKDDVTSDDNEQLSDEFDEEEICGD